MAQIIRIGDVLVNLDFLVSIELARPARPPSDTETVIVEGGRAICFQGPDAEAVRRLVRSFPRFPAGEDSAEAVGVTEYATGLDVLAPEVRQANEGK